MGRLRLVGSGLLLGAACVVLSACQVNGSAVVRTDSSGLAEAPVDGSAPAHETSRETSTAVIQSPQSSSATKSTSTTPAPGTITTTSSQPNKVADAGPAGTRQEQGSGDNGANGRSNNQGNGDQGNGNPAGNGPATKSAALSTTPATATIAKGEVNCRPDGNGKVQATLDYVLTGGATGLRLTYRFGSVTVDAGTIEGSSGSSPVLPDGCNNDSVHYLISTIGGAESDSKDIVAGQLSASATEAAVSITGVNCSRATENAAPTLVLSYQTNNAASVTLTAVKTAGPGDEPTYQTTAQDAAGQISLPGEWCYKGRAHTIKLVTVNSGTKASTATQLVGKMERTDGLQVPPPAANAPKPVVVLDAPTCSKNQSTGVVTLTISYKVTGADRVGVHLYSSSIDFGIFDQQNSRQIAGYDGMAVLDGRLCIGSGQTVVYGVSVGSNSAGQSGDSSVAVDAVYDGGKVVYPNYRLGG